MIRSFRHKGLQRFYQSGNTAGVDSHHASRLRLILGRLEVSEHPDDLNLPGLHLHQLSGRHRGIWSARVSANWRVTFRFEGQDAFEVAYEDYH